MPVPKVMSAMDSQARLKFGALSDVQYANCEDRPATSHSKKRYYRQSLLQVDRAFSQWEKEGVQFVLQLGDIVDALNKETADTSYGGLREVLSHFECHGNFPTFHTIGNHELYNFNRVEVARLFYESMCKISIPSQVFCPVEPSPDPVLYYQFCPHPSLKFISIDCYDICMLGYPKDHPKYQEARALLKSMHRHEIISEWDWCGHLKGLDVRFQMMNGSLSADQLNWLDQELSQSDELKQDVIVFGHVGVNPDSVSDKSCLMWNYEEVMEVFHRHHCVRAYFSGHSHGSGFAVDSRGIGYVSLMAIVETPPETSAFATISVFHDHLTVEGHGIEFSCTIPFVRKEQVRRNSVGESEVEPASSTIKVEV